MGAAPCGAAVCGTRTARATCEGIGNQGASGSSLGPGKREPLGQPYGRSRGSRTASSQGNANRSRSSIVSPFGTLFAPHGRRGRWCLQCRVCQGLSEIKVKSMFWMRPTWTCVPSRHHIRTTCCPKPGSLGQQVVPITKVNRGLAALAPRQTRSGRYSISLRRRRLFIHLQAPGFRRRQG